MPEEKKKVGRPSGRKQTCLQVMQPTELLSQLGNGNPKAGQKILTNLLKNLSQKEVEVLRLIRD